MAEKSIVCFAGNDWWIHNPLTEKQWMTQLAARGWRVLFVNSIGVGMPAFSSPGIGRRLLMKLTSILRWLRRSQGVLVLTPVLLPFWSVPPVRLFNCLLLEMQVRLALLLNRMRKPVFWSGIPTAALLIGRIPHSSVVYYVQDHFTAYYDAMNFTRIYQDHEHMLSASDVVICASRGMHDLLEGRCREIRYIAHGVSEQFLRIPLHPPRELPEEMKAITHPIIGYWGSLEALQDLDLIEFLAERRPEWSLVFIGRVMFDRKRFQDFPNVHFLGPKPIEEIPRYGINFDVLMLSFIQSEWIKFSCPIKFREYLALGKPVVSADIIEVERAYPGIARIARSHEEFEKFIEEALTDLSMEKARVRRNLVANETWDTTADRVNEVLANLLREN